MIVNKKTTLVLLVGCFAISSLTLSGCRSGGFKKPNLAVLKFWEAPEEVASKKTPPPPARYFDPAPIVEEQIAQKGTGGTAETIELNGQRFKDTLKQATAKNTPAIAKNANTNLSSLSAAIQKPKVSAPLATAKNDFQAALKNPFKEVKNVASLEKALASTPTKPNDFKLPANLQTAKLKTQTKQSLSKLNKSIYDADGKLVQSTQDVKNSILNKLNSSKGSQTVATKTPGANLNQFVAAAKEKTLAPLKPNNFDFKAATLPKSAPPVNTKTASVASDAKLKLVQAQVADANRQIELLKQQIAQVANQPKAQVAAAPAPIQRIPQTNTFAKPQPIPTPPAAQVAQLKTPRFGTSSQPTGNFIKPESSFAGTSPTNILRASQQSLRTPPAAPPASTGAAFPTTPHGNFAPQGNFGSNYVPTANLDRSNSTDFVPQRAAPVNFQTGAHPSAGAQQIKSHIPGVDIPDSILSGSGSYAPGSVHQVGQ